MTYLFYIATGFRNKVLHNQIRDALVSRGHRITYDWTQTIEEKSPAIAEQEVEGVVSADFVVVLLPGKFGTHAELGAALAIENKVFLAGPRETECIFYEHPLVTDLGTEIDETRLIAAIDAWVQERERAQAVLRELAR